MRWVGRRRGGGEAGGLGLGKPLGARQPRRHIKGHLGTRVGVRCEGLGGGDPRGACLKRSEARPLSSLLAEGEKRWMAPTPDPRPRPHARLVATPRPFPRGRAQATKRAGHPGDAATTPLQENQQNACRSRTTNGGPGEASASQFAFSAQAQPFFRFLTNTREHTQKRAICSEGCAHGHVCEGPASFFLLIGPRGFGGGLLGPHFSSDPQPPLPSNRHPPQHSAGTLERATEASRWARLR